MGKKIICALAVMVLAFCLLSGGCSTPSPTKITDWRDMFKITPSKSADTAGNKSTSATDGNEKPTAIATTSVKLYFAGPDGKLGVEKRTVPKVQGLARETLKELLKGPQNKKYSPVAPNNTRLVDINLKPDGLCIVNLSAEARQVKNKQQEEMMIHTIVNTLGQFPAIKRVAFMIEGCKVDTIGNFVNISAAVEPDYNL